jgi:hypothetical protein
MSYRGHIKNGVAVLDTAVDLPDGTPVRIEVVETNGQFFQNKTVDELAAEQHVHPIAGLEALAGNWPDNDSVDELLVLLRGVRS